MSNMQATLKLRADLQRQISNHEKNRSTNLELLKQEERTRLTIKGRRPAMITEGHSDKTIKAMVERSESKTRTLIDRNINCDKFLAAGKIQLSGFDRRIVEAAVEEYQKTMKAESPTSKLTLENAREFQKRLDARPTKRQSQAINTRP